MIKKTTKKAAKKKRKTTTRKRTTKYDDIAPIHPWDRQPDESDPAYRAFSYFRDLREERTLRKTADDLGKTYSLITRWASKEENDWGIRVKAFDVYEDRQRRKEEAAEIRKMNRRHARNAMKGMRAAMNSIEKYLPTKDNPKPKVMGPTVATRLLDVCARLERMARGEPESTTEVNLGVVSADEKRAKMRKLLTDPRAGKVMEGLAKLLRSDAQAHRP